MTTYSPDTPAHKRAWWFSVAPFDAPVEPRRVERFETMEQALLHAAATDGFVPFVYNELYVNPSAAKRLYDYYFDLSDLYDYYFDLSEPTK